MYISTYEHPFIFLLVNNYLEVEWLEHMLDISLIFKETVKLFSKGVVLLHILKGSI